MREVNDDNAIVSSITDEQSIVFIATDTKGKVEVQRSVVTTDETFDVEVGDVINHQSMVARVRDNDPLVTGVQTHVTRII